MALDLTDGLWAAENAAMAAELRIGTSSFTAAGWEKSFYPAGMKSADYLAYYAEHFSTLEIDSTFYRTPAAKTVRRWHDQTPAGFRFACKAPQKITHEKSLLDCDDDLAYFTQTMGALGEKLSAVLLQFPYFNKKAFARGEEFCRRLEAFLPLLSAEIRWAIEVRNKGWVGERLLDLLRRHGVALALVDHPWMLRPAEYLERETLTTGFTYLRLLGDRYAIEEQTQSWDQVVWERGREVSEWVNACRRIRHRGVELLVYVNNHFEGHAPATVRKFLEAWGEDGVVKPEAGSAASHRGAELFHTANTAKP